MSANATRLWRLVVRTSLAITCEETAKAISSLRTNPRLGLIAKPGTSIMHYSWIVTVFDSV